MLQPLTPARAKHHMLMVKTKKKRCRRIEDDKGNNKDA